MAVGRCVRGCWGTGMTGRGQNVLLRQPDACTRRASTGIHSRCGRLVDRSQNAFSYHERIYTRSTNPGTSWYAEDFARCCRNLNRRSLACVQRDTTDVLAKQAGGSAIRRNGQSIERAAKNQPQRRLHQIRLADAFHDPVIHVGEHLRCNLVRRVVDTHSNIQAGRV